MMSDLVFYGTLAIGCMGVIVLLAGLVVLTQLIADDEPD